MKGILINPFERTVGYIDMDQDSMLKELYKAIDCSCVTTVSIPAPGMEHVFVDDEGLFDASKDKGFMIEGLPPLTGCGVVLGCDLEGNTIQSTLEPSLLEKKIKWFDRDEMSDIVVGW
jgi:hypothetical protein